jgi:hypothetical protein
MYLLKQLYKPKKINNMKNAILNRLYLLIFLASIGGMIAFILGAEAETQAAKFNAMLGMLFAETTIIFSIIILFVENSNKK